ncbi:lipoprotein [Gammaproteobacteria bacterium]|nr:lipoprotein [Gammaproteobacteria bacterium]
MKYTTEIFILSISLFLVSCATQSTPRDHTAFKESNPKSILVLPPINSSVDVKASYSVLTQITHPFSEAGYYVLPVAVVENTFRQNGMSVAEDIQALSYTKLHEIFGADTALYLNIIKYGSSYMIVSSETVVSVEGRLIDLKTGKEIWKGSASASSNESRSNSSGNSLIGMLIGAALTQISDTITDKGYGLAATANGRLASGILSGPRSPKYYLSTEQNK